MKISLLTPTRDRPDNIVRFIDSVVDTISNDNYIEILFYVDYDDINTTRIINNYCVKLTKKIEIKSMCDVKENWYNKWWNFLWKMATGDVFMQCGDDLIFRTKNWDNVIADEINKYNDKMVVINPNDGSCDSHKRATHPILTKEWCDAVGYFVPGIFAGAMNDTWITDISKRVNRLVYLDEVLIEHMHPDFGKAPNDIVYEKQKNMAVDNNVFELFDKTEDKRNDDIKKIKKHILKYCDKNE